MSSTAMNTELGALLKRLRINAGFGLRQFAEMVEVQPSNWSAIEHGRRPLPEDRDKLMQIADILGLVSAEDRAEFFDAATRTGQLPADVQHLSDRKLVPALLRTIDNRNLSDSEIQALIAEIESM